LIIAAAHATKFNKIKAPPLFECRRAAAVRALSATTKATAREWAIRRLLGGARECDNVLGEGLESRPIWLFYSDGNMAGFSGFDIVHGAVFSFVCATDDLASSAVS